MKLFGKATIAACLLAVCGIVTINTYPTHQTMVVDATIMDKMIIPSKKGELVLIHRDTYGNVADTLVTPASYSTLRIGDHINVTKKVGEVYPNHAYKKWESLVIGLSLVSVALAGIMVMFYFLMGDDTEYSY